jgi:hypothetical protein
MIRRCLAAAIIILCWNNSLPAATPQQVDQSVKRAVDWLYAQQKDGTWEEKPSRDPEGKVWSVSGGQWGGLTGLVTYALLAAGESPQDERLVKPIEFLKKADLIGTYALAMRAQVWLLLPSTPETKALIIKDANELRGFLLTKGENSGMFGYVTKSYDYSHSRSNYGVLGMWALEQGAVEVPIDFWKTIEKGWIDHQDPSGGWTYTKENKNNYPLTPGMTAAGLASLFITQEYVNPGRGLNCMPSPQSVAIDKGLKWLEEHFDQVAVDKVFGSRDYKYATLYAVERVGVASGLKYFGEVNWYQKGSDWLIKKQRQDGCWDDELKDTCFALLFLARGRSPIVMNKLDYSAGAPKVGWNVRPGDASHLVRWVSKSVERDLHWQITNITAPAEELSDAPILYLAGRDEWTPDEDAKAKIKQFIDAGGMVLANGDCTGKAFVTSVRKLGMEMFPGYDFRELPNDHPIYTEEQFRRDKWKNKPSVLGMSNGVRELMLVVPNDPAKVWQMGLVGGKEESWQLGANIILYAVDKRGLRARGDTHLVKREPKKKASKTIALARLEYAGNWNPEPGGWRRMVDVMFNRGVDLKVTTVKSPDEIAGAKIIHLTGTKPITLDAAAQDALKEVIGSGGTLIIDAAGGSAEFATSVERLIPQLAKESLKPIPPDHALYSAGGAKLDEIKFRDYAVRAVGTAREPKLQGVEQNGRYVIVYSREDLSAGLVGQAVDGIIGYDPASATAIMTHVLSYAAQSAKK